MQIVVNISNIYLFNAPKVGILKCASLVLWKHHVNLRPQNFRSVSSDLHQVLIMRIISTDEDPSLRIESFAITNLRSVSTKLN